MMQRVTERETERERERDQVVYALCCDNTIFRQGFRLGYGLGLSQCSAVVI